MCITYLRKIFTIFSIAYYSIFIHVNASHAEFKFRHITSKDGLSSNYINCIFQDSYGLIWIGTQYGLNCYDGYSFKIYTNNPKNLNTITNNEVLTICEDSIKGNLWVGTKFGLNYYDRDKNIFIRYKMDTVGSWRYDRRNTINHVYKDSENIIWIGTRFGLYIFNRESNTFTRFLQDRDEKYGLSNSMIEEFFEDSKNNLFIISYNGVDQYDRNNKIIIKKIHGIQKFPFIPIRSIYEDFNNNIWIGSLYHGLFLIKDTDTWDYIHYSKNLGLEISDNVMAINEFEPGNLIFAVRDLGLFSIDLNNNNIVDLYRANRADINSINSNVPICIHKDDDHSLWVGTYSGGINIIDCNQKSFNTYSLNTRINDLAANKVRAAFQDSEGDIWIGSKEEGGLSKFVPENRNHPFTHFTPNENSRYSITDDYVFSILEDTPGYLWIGTLKGGLCLFEKSSGKFYKYKYLVGKRKNQNESPIYALLKDSKQRLWIGDNLNGIFVIDKNKKPIYPFKEFDEVLYCRTLYEDKYNNIWMGFSVGGLRCYDEKRDTLLEFKYQSDDSTSISSNFVECILEDSKGRFWVGTHEGLNLMNRINNTFTVFREIDGLPSNIIRGILEDKQGFLWLSTSNGLSKFDPDNKTFKNYSHEDGLFNNDFNRNAYCKTSDGKLIFGSNDGFTYFDPKNIADNKNIPPLVITDFKINNQSVKVGYPGSPLKRNIMNTKEIVLNYNQNSFSFQFAALNYSATHKNQYAYYLDGFDSPVPQSFEKKVIHTTSNHKEWIHNENRRIATYTNVPPGDYIFRVIASNNDGYWNKEGFSIRIKIRPYPWYSWKAITLYAIFFLLIVFFTIRYFILRKKYINEQIEKERIDNISSTRSRFFASFSNEIKAPLTLIFSPLQSSLKTGKIKTELLKLMYQSARSLLILFNELIDIPKLDRGTLKLKISNGNIVEYIKKITYSFQNNAEEKRISLQYISDKNELNAWFDKDILEKVLYNLVSNAFKYTPENGKIIVKLYPYNEKFIVQHTEDNYISEYSKNERTQLLNDQYICIEVKDNGVGIEEENLDKIFERYFQANANEVNNKGIGIGLSLVKEYVELHKGKICVESKVNEGSTFRIKIPIRKEFYNQNIVQLENNESLEDQYRLVDEDDEERIAYAQEENINHEFDDSNKSKKRKPFILVVDDDPDIQHLFKYFLEDEYKVEFAQDGEVGYDKITQLKPNLVICDLMMPKMDGYELTRKIKANNQTKSIPIIILSVKHLSDDIVKAYNLGVDDYFVKPFNLDEIKARMNSLLEKRHKEKLTGKLHKISDGAVLIEGIDNDLFETINALIEKNLSNPKFGISDLVNETGVSKINLYRKFKQYTDKTIKEYIRNYRLNKASDLLVNSQFTFSEIAYMVGFNDYSYFRKIFFKHFGKSPTDYIKEHAIEY